MVKSWAIGVVIVSMLGMAAAQKPYAPHQAKGAVKSAHKAAALPPVKAGAGANATDAQLKALEQQTAKILGAGQPKQKAAPAKLKVAPAGGKKMPPMDFKPQHPQGAKPAGHAGVPKNGYPHH